MSLGILGSIVKIINAANTQIACPISHIPTKASDIFQNLRLFLLEFGFNKLIILQAYGLGFVFIFE